MGGLVAGLTSIPEGIGYAQLAAINPMMGIYSGMAPVLAGALSAGTVRMITTLTSAIALTVGGLLATGSIPSEQVPAAVVTISLLAGVFMIVLGVLRLGRLMNLVSHAVMTGFVAGIGLLIIVSKVPELLGFTAPSSDSKVVRAVDALVHPGAWQIEVAALSVGTLGLVLLLHAWRRTRTLSLLLALVVGTAVASVLDLGVPRLGDSVDIPGGLAALPIPTSLDQLPDLSLVPQLVLTAAAVTVIALAEGAGIRPTFPNLSGSPSSSSRDFIGAGVANLAGSLFQSPPVGGSLSRTAMSVSSGGRTRWAGVFAALWLVVIVLLVSPLIARIPDAVIAGLLVGVGIEIVRSRSHEIAFAWRSGGITIAMVALTALLVITVPIQWAVAIPVLLSLVEFTYLAATKVRLVAYEYVDGGWIEVPGRAPGFLEAGAVCVLRREGPEFYGAVPGLIDALPRPSTSGAPGVLVFDLGSILTMSDTLARGLRAYATEVTTEGAGLVLCGLRPTPLDRLRRVDLPAIVGNENLLAYEPRLGADLDAGAARGRALLASLTS